LCDRQSFRAPALCQRQGLTAAEPFGFDAFDMAVPGEDDFGHASTLRPVQSRQDGAARDPVLVIVREKIERVREMRDVKPHNTSDCFPPSIATATVAS